MADTYDLVAKNIKLILEYLQDNKILILRLLYLDSHGDMMSMTMPTTKVASLEINKLIRFLTINDRTLIPDASTGFSDPSSVQENYCVISNFPGDERYAIHNKKIEISTTIHVVLNEYSVNNLDIFHDFRNELMLEGIKAGVDVISHTTTNNRTQSIFFEADSLLRLADSIHKMRFLINCIAGSYGQSIDLSSKENIVELYKRSGRVMLTDLIEANPYFLVKNF